jgi:hypothetical protein
LGRNVKGILVGCDDEDVGGYEWVIKHNDFDNSNPEIINKLEKYKDIKYFKIYFYVFKTPTEESARTSDEYRGTIFGRAEIKKVERNRNDPEKYKYVHHVKIKNFEPFEPKIKLEDVEDELENYGWTEDQKANFGVNLSHHGLLLTEKDCNLINKLVLKSGVDNNKTGNIDDAEAMKMKKRNIDVKNNKELNNNDKAGLLMGYYPNPKPREGFEHVIDHCEESAKENRTVLSRAKEMIGKTAYFYIWKDVDISSKEYYGDNYFSRVHGGEQGIFGKIFGEGIIEDVFQKNDRNYITYKYIIHYRDYVDFDKVKKLVERMNKNRWNKRRIRIGLFLTREECNKISSLGGVD